ncbi:MAG TPA: tyrosine/phenylalanine carboxypeptidase domain-containing protein, partial [Polyangiaceae bacterium]|nr:tyrosine/phenylalanine carboxypeptidase domain-containing protein [Polyangiaceae bacterium]
AMRPTPPERVPPALERALVALEAAARRVRLLEAATPLNAEPELLRLSGARRSGRRPEPAFAYAAPPRAGELSAPLEALAGWLEGEAPPGPRLAERARELAEEARLADAVGTAAFPVLAARRFRSGPADDARAERWAHLPPDEPGDERLVASDDASNPDSLLCRMRAAVGRLRLPVRVVVRPGLAALAAAGESTLYVAEGRWLGPRDVARTVLHEVWGHALPALARARSPYPLASRPAGDADREEGRALLLEARAGFLDRAHKKELGLRHLAARMAHESVPFHDVVDRLEGLGAGAARALRLAARATRGGGLGRERIYLPMLRLAYAEARERGRRPGESAPPEAASVNGT